MLSARYQGAAAVEVRRALPRPSSPGPVGTSLKSSQRQFRFSLCPRCKSFPLFFDGSTAHQIRRCVVFAGRLDRSSRRFTARAIPMAYREKTSANPMTSCGGLWFRAVGAGCMSAWESWQETESESCKSAGVLHGRH